MVYVCLYTEIRLNINNHAFVSFVSFNAALDVAPYYIMP